MGGVPASGRSVYLTKRFSSLFQTIFERHGLTEDAIAAQAMRV
jgi:hypothetical protein